jgi:hypothetical protein
MTTTVKEIVAAVTAEVSAMTPTAERALAAVTAATAVLSPTATTQTAAIFYKNLRNTIFGIII